ncbi:MAG: OB-fold nucleic acid binding domain-containing protein [Desulfurococcaceae archaeon]
MESDRKETKGSSILTNIIDLKPGMENVTVRGRVLVKTPPRTIETSKGTRTISNAMIGDSTGRVEVVMWGEKVTTLKEGDVVEIKGAWVSEYRGKVQLNIGKSTTVTEIPANSVPEEIPEAEPRATGTYQRKPSRRFNKKKFYRRRGDEGE